MQFSVSIFERRVGPAYLWRTLGLGQYNRSRHGRSALKIEQSLAGELKGIIAKIEPVELEAFQVPRGMRLERLHLDLNLRGAGGRRRVAGVFPLLLTPRWAGPERKVLVAYHPLRQDEWFPAREDLPLDEQASQYFGQAWADLDEEELDELRSGKKDTLRAISFHAQPRSLMDRLPGEKKGLWSDLKPERRKRGSAKGGEQHPGRPGKPKRRSLRVLPKIGSNLTLQAIEGSLPIGMPRSPYREQLQLLLRGEKKSCILLVGPPGCGKTTLLYRLVQDLLELDDYESHRNLDAIHEVWQTSGKRIIAGMSYIGDWEKRCLDLVRDAAHAKRILYVEDVTAFALIGRSRESERSLADFFHGPAARGDVLFVGECTPEQLQRLEDEAPSFAALFTRLAVQPSSEQETMRLLLHEARRVEAHCSVEIHPFALRSILELGGALLAGSALPGKALGLLRELGRGLGREPAARPAGGALPEIGTAQVLELLSRKTGLPQALLQPRTRLEPAEIEAEFASQVMGQPEAVAAACDLVVRIRSGLTDPRRPWGVYLFTGPTGTGKTEMARAIAAYLYGDERRLVRLDMGELGTGDGAARLIGDRWRPEGLLTQKIREQPFSVVLFDEIEKAEPELLNLLLQLFDEGRLTDASGSTADFTRCVLLMTSNLGARSRAPVRFGDPDEGWRADTDRAIREFFPPELFNRIDRIVHFGPLAAESAERIVDKELARFLARPGLSGRNIFVTVSRAVRQSILRQGFDPRYGARTLKRYLEDALTPMLTQAILASAGASMQLFRLYERAGALALAVERLREREPASASWRLERLGDRPLGRLQESLAEEVGFLEALERGPELLEISERIRLHLEELRLGVAENAETLYRLDDLRQRLREFRELLDGLTRLQAEEDSELLEIASFGQYIIEPARDRWSDPQRFRMFDLRAFGQGRGRPAREQILDALAEVQFLRRALKLVHERGQHAIFVELLRVGESGAEERFAGAESRLLGWLKTAYSGARGEVEEAESSGGGHWALKLVGLCVLDFFEGEQGCHVWHSLARMPEIVRVRVWPAEPGRTARSVLDAHVRELAEYHRALEENVRELPPNPEALLPVVRQISFEPPLREGEQALAELEDYYLGTSLRRRCRNPGEALPVLWRLRMSRED